ncbi:MAG: hypothetical protein ABH800_00890 [Candidatus Nealsonbacteria bacterium]
MNVLKKLQNFPLGTRKIIFWVVIVVLGVGLFVWRIGYFAQRINSIEKEGSGGIQEFQSVKEEISDAVKGIGDLVKKYKVLFKEEFDE